MPSKRPLLNGAKLYVIVDGAVCGDRDPVAIAREAQAGGADIIQWRAKRWTAKARWETGRAIADALRPTRTLFIVNDHLDLALALEADGVHLGQEDLPVAVARRLAGPALVVGVSTHSLAQAQTAEQQGADYVGIGPVFPTPTKPEYASLGPGVVAAVAAAVRVPWVAIGGIDQVNLPLVLSAGATRVAVVRAVAGAPDVRHAAQAFKAMLA